ncbi:MAG TPA: SAVED domain-containing protein [Polyangiaceae bacterium]|nr:SAVED domain-containing protein [Polyangiaceae bacterium]
MVQALPPDVKVLPRPEVVLDVVQIPMDATATIDWSDVRQKTERALQELLRPRLEQSPGYHLAYFGAAPIPLAMFLGFRVGTWATIHPFQKRHDTRAWTWKSTEKTVEVEVKGIPNDRTRMRGDVVIQVATSHPIELQDVLSIVPTPLAEISIRTTPTDPDALNSSADIEAVAQEFEKVLDAILDRCPNAECIHVFASVPVGMAFRLGSCVSPTKHHRVKTYQYLRHATPKYAPALVLQEPSERAIILDDVARERAGETRRAWEQERQRLASFGNTLRRYQPSTETWLPALFPNESATWSPGQRLATLPPLWKVGFEHMRVGQDSSSLAEFRFDQNSREWQFGDALLAGIARQIHSDEDLRRAGRMFLLHEGLHEAAQGVTSATSARIGRFPKLLEEVDYLADVWAMLHDYALERDTPGKDPDTRTHMLKCVDVALGSFWGFDDQGTELAEVQVRRLHRYLIWTWQKLRLEQEAGGEAAVVQILFDRPMLELAGPPMVPRRERIYFDLNPKLVESPEIMVLDGKRVRRYSSGPSTPVENILEGFRRRDSAIIRDALQGVYDQVRRGALRQAHLRRKQHLSDSP